MWLNWISAIDYHALTINLLLVECVLINIKVGKYIICTAFRHSLSIEMCSCKSTCNTHRHSVESVFYRDPRQQELIHLFAYIKDSFNVILRDSLIVTNFNWNCCAHWIGNNVPWSCHNFILNRYWQQCHKLWFAVSFAICLIPVLFHNSPVLFIFDDCL